MKVYRNSANPNVIGCKFDNLKYSQVQISASGELDGDGVVFEFTTRDRKTQGDFNADEHFTKDYDANMVRIFGDMLGVGDDDESRFDVKHLPSGDAFAQLCVTKAQDGRYDFDGLVGCLLSVLSSCVN